MRDCYNPTHRFYVVLHQLRVRQHGELRFLQIRPPAVDHTAHKPERRSPLREGERRLRQNVNKFLTSMFIRNVLASDDSS